MLKAAKNCTYSWLDLSVDDRRRLGALLADIESDRVERKPSLADASKIRQTVCAFANDLPNHRQPGVLFIGARDDGSCAGLAITDQLLLALSDIRSDGNTVPFPNITVQKRVLNGCELAVVIVQPSDAPPIRYQGRVWIRVGPGLSPATPEEERRLNEKRRSRDLPTDATPVEHATLNDLDLELFRASYLPASVAPEIIEENRRPLEQQMESLRLITRRDGEWIPTVLGILVTGKSRAILSLEPTSSSCAWMVQIFPTPFLILPTSARPFRK